MVKTKFPCCSDSAALRQFVGNKAKGRISKRVFQENEPRQIFRKTNISNTLTHTRTKHMNHYSHRKDCRVFFFFLEVTITLAMKISVAMNCKKYFIFLLYWWLWTIFCLPEIVCIYYLFLLIRRKTLENEDNISSTSLKIKVSFCFSL